jgi:predicted PurR-regulated permease PerM
MLGQGLLQISLVLFIVFFLYRDGARIQAQLETGAARLGGELGASCSSWPATPSRR